MPRAIRIGRPVDGLKVQEIARAFASTGPSDRRTTSQDCSLVAPFISPTRVRDQLVIAMRRRSGRYRAARPIGGLPGSGGARDALD
jgi:hypothetical protein